MWQRNLFLILAVSLLGACASSVNVDFDRQADLAYLKTFKLEASPQIKTGDPRIDSPLVEKRIRASILKYLQARDYVLDESAADFLVRYQISIKQEIETDKSGVVIGFGTAGRHSAIGLSYGFPINQTGSVDKAVLTIDVIDARSGDLLWRGSYGKRLYDGLTPEKLDTTIDTTVREILSRFPPGSNK